MRKITISKREYSELISAKNKLEILMEYMENLKEMTEIEVRQKIFEEFVNKDPHPVSREKCGEILGFEVGNV